MTRLAENFKALGVADYDLVEGKDAIQSDVWFSFISDPTSIIQKLCMGAP